MGSDYEVGFKKPPKESRFQPNQSGNPSGRPKKRKKVKSAFEILAQELNRQYPVIRDGVPENVLAKQAFLQRAVQGGIVGGKDAQLLLKLIINAEKLAYF